MTNQIHTAFIITGLGDDVYAYHFATKRWHQHNLNPVVHRVGWQDKESTYRQKITELIDRIKYHQNKNHQVSLIGISAGGSLAINAAVQLNFRIHKVVTICSRLRVGNASGFRSFSSRTASSPIFRESVKVCEESISTLTKAQKSKIFNLYSFFGDELVPSNTAIIDGCDHYAIPCIGHIPSIFISMTYKSKPIISFLNGIFWK